VEEQVRTAMGPREVFARMREQWLGNAVSPMDSLLADDAVIEAPFAPPGRPRRFEGREPRQGGPGCRCGSRSAGRSRSTTPPIRR
jgi:hypothetical protein